MESAVVCRTAHRHWWVHRFVHARRPMDVVNMDVIDFGLEDPKIFSLTEVVAKMYLQLTLFTTSGYTFFIAVQFCQVGMKNVAIKNCRQNNYFICS